MLHPVPLPLPELGVRRRLVRRVQSALDAGKLEVHYQPKVQVDTGEATGVEALLRWRESTHRLVAPVDFLPQIESHPVMEAVGRHVLDTALAQAARWRAADIPLTVSVNATPASLHDPGLPGAIADALARWGVPPQRLVLEITETAVLRDLDRSAAILRDVAAQGVGVSLDDFGTGHSSLSRLLELPIDELKIDRGFVRDMTRDSAGGAVVAAVVALAQDLGHRVVAEGVEDAETLERLAEIGCDEAQGYHLCRPVPADQLPAWALRGSGREALVGG